MTLVAGVDCSTQSTKVVVCDAGTGEVVRTGQAPHPDATEVDPGVWWDALGAATDAGLLDGVAAVAVAGQQHGMVCLDESGDVVRPALLWHDTRSAGAAADLVADLGGPAAWAQATGSVPVASFTVTKLRWLATHEPAHAARVARVLLPHDWLTWRLAGAPAEATTDRGDASGTGYFSPSTGQWRHDLLTLALGHDADLPRVASPSEIVAEIPPPAVRAGGSTAGGRFPAGAVLAAGTGDNMAAALGLGMVPGDVAVSIGTSGTVFAVADARTADPTRAVAGFADAPTADARTADPTGAVAGFADATGAVAGFADATGRYLPLVCTLNAARVLTAAAALLGVDLDRLAALALSAPAGAGGLVMLPYLDGERTPNLPAATGLLAGLTRAAASPANLARAAVEGMLCGLADGLDALRAVGVPVRRVLLLGGAARSPAIQAIAPAVLGMPVTRPEPAEYVALGAARQAAWALAGTPDPPAWPVPSHTDHAEPTPHVRAAYAHVRTGAASLLGG